MLVYTFSYIILLLISLFDVFDESLINEYLKEIMLFSLVFLLIILAGVRFEIGMDFSAYYNFFQRVDSMDGNASYNYLEPGFRLIIIFFKSISFHPYFLFFTYASIMYSFIFIGIKRLSPLPFLSLFVFFTIFMIGYVFNVMRQGIAMSILVYLIPDFKEKNIYKVLFMTFFAASIHSSGFFILICYLLYHFRIGKKVYILLTFISVTYFMVSVELSTLFIKFMPMSIQGKIVSYMDRFPGEVSLSSYVLRLIFIGVLFYYYDRLMKSGEYNGIVNIYFFGFFLYSLFSFQNMAAARLNMFFRILEIILIPLIVNMSKNKIEKTIVLSLFIAIATAIFLKDLQHPVNYPFQFYWINQP